MTIAEECQAYCEERGMFPQQAEGAVAKLREILTEEGTDTKFLSDRFDDYPSSFKSIVILRLRYAAVAWIDANLPRAWYRPMFVE